MDFSLEILGERSASGCHRVDFVARFAIFDKWRRVMRFDLRVNHEGASTSPVFVLGKGSNAVDIVSWIASCERHPQEVRYRSSCKLGVVYNDNHGDRLGVARMGKRAF